MDEVVYASILKVDTTKRLLKEIRKKFIKFDMNEKHHYLDLLNNTKYDEVKEVRDHIMLLSSYYNKSEGPKDGAHHMGERNEYFNARELMIIPQCYDISVWNIFLGIEWKG